MELDDADVRAILQLLDASAFDELQVQTDRFKLTLRRAEGTAWTRESRTLGTPRELPDTPAAAAAAAPPAAPPVAPARAATPAAAITATAARAAQESDHADLIAVCSPLPGTFYRSPKPGAPPFVDLGSRVERDTVVAIVETMKLMNSIYAGAAGRIAEICRGDAEAVTPEAVLMRIEPEPA
jgi:acetyl-CoA carboxylase biotin carboxyl carrier protein